MPVEEPYCNGRTFIPSVNQVLRELKRQEVGLYNCVCSVLSDVAFVREISHLYSPLPLLANLRCGLWYAPKHDSTCYFKSTDGHYGNWGFSCTRLNLHTARLAAEKGGCIIVDATRRGKSFPVSGVSPLPILCRARNMSSHECNLTPLCRMPSPRQCQSGVQCSTEPSALSGSSCSRKAAQAVVASLRLSHSHLTGTVTCTYRHGCQPMRPITSACALTVGQMSSCRWLEAVLACLPAEPSIRLRTPSLHDNIMPVSM